MSLEPTLKPAPPATTIVHRRHALPGDEVRPFGTKATVLQLRRRSRSARRASDDEDSAGVSVASHDASVCVRLMPVVGGLLVERVQRRPAECLLHQSLLFTNVHQYEAWCDAEPLRLEEPALWVRLRRCGDEAFPRQR